MYRRSYQDAAHDRYADDADLNSRQAQQRRLLGRRMDRAIWDAFRSREFAPIEALLAHGADAGYVRTEGGGETALMAAAYHGREEICRALLSRGADPRKQDKRGHDAAALVAMAVRHAPHAPSSLTHRGDAQPPLRRGDGRRQLRPQPLGLALPDRPRRLYLRPRRPLHPHGASPAAQLQPPGKIQGGGLRRMRVVVATLS